MGGVIRQLWFVVGQTSSQSDDPTKAALDAMWSGSSRGEQLSLCATYRLAGEERVVREFMDEQPELNEPTVRVWWRERCAS